MNTMHNFGSIKIKSVKPPYLHKCNRNKLNKEITDTTRRTQEVTLSFK